MASPSPLQGFKKLNDIIFFRPSSSSSTSTTNFPHTILILTWVGATKRQISKYVDGYLHLYPTSQIYLITSGYLEYATTSYSAQVKILTPLATSLLTIPSCNILVVCYSNGGAMKLSSLALAIKTLSNSPFKAKAILFDSCPGRISLQVSLKSPEQRICETYPTQAGMNAAKPVMPKNWYTYYPLYFTMLGMAIATGIVYDVTGIEDSMKRSRRLLNDKETFSLETKRGYVFSDADDIVVAKDVLDHAVEARERGWDVGIERFVGTGHCGHLRGDEKRYWGIVEGLVGKEFMRSKL